MSTLERGYGGIAPAPFQPLVKQGFAVERRRTIAKLVSAFAFSAVVVCVVFSSSSSPALPQLTASSPPSRMTSLMQAPEMVLASKAAGFDLTMLLQKEAQVSDRWRGASLRSTDSVQPASAFGHSTGSYSQLSTMCPHPQLPDDVLDREEPPEFSLRTTELENSVSNTGLCRKRDKIIQLFNDLLKRLVGEASAQTTYYTTLETATADAKTSFDDAEAASELAKKTHGDAERMKNLALTEAATAITAFGAAKDTYALNRAPFDAELTSIDDDIALIKELLQAYA
ncbi:hypothetical protein T484DRAFT_1803514 [Baffinella frigidus]|nr:hypothetical protein T484DRAFT_1803514 [Cryptophyta sp. CCMP2293]